MSGEMSDDTIAELSRLRAFALRIGPIVKAALELREIGRSMERLEDGMSRRSVKRAPLGDFVDLLGDIYDVFSPNEPKAIKTP